MAGERISSPGRAPRAAVRRQGERGAGGRITAVLGPTNTGKTHHAIERMIAHRSGIIGLPLRLLAREVYERLCEKRGRGAVALVTGEERIVPPGARYWACTVEAMPADIGADYLAIDEIQLCADPERGHVFTDRLLHARGRLETQFLGAATMRGAIADLVPEAGFLEAERFSALSYTGAKKISRMPRRAAIVGFSVENLYAVAELIRRQKGGAAVVTGALSPRTRNAQVAMYQSGEVDYLVATDAIGMGLNLDIDHVAFAALRKFDGRRMRALLPHELGQIAGRAGRHTRPGTFGVTGEAAPLDPGLAAAIEGHRFAPVRRLQWRNSDLGFASPEALIAALEAAPADPRLERGREADDMQALRLLSATPEIRARIAAPQDVRRLWDVCRIPDFRAISPGEHAALLARIFAFLQEEGRVPDDWLARQVRRIDRTEGDIDTLSRRLAFIRTWTYVAQRKGWVDDENHWRGETRKVEDRLSDALHGALTKRFVDRRTSVLMRRLKQKEGLVARVSETGEVSVEDQHVGRLEGFRFIEDKAAGAQEAKTLRQAAHDALKPEFSLRADRFYNAPDTEIDFTDQGGLMWGEHAVGRLVRGPEALKPGVVAFVDEEAGAEVAEKVRRRLQHFIDRRIAALFEPLLAMQRDEALTGLARGFAFRLVEALGILPREAVAEEVKALDQEMRALLRRHGVRFGQYTIFFPALLKPAPTRLRLVLWALANDLAEFPESPPPGLVTIPVSPAAPEGWPEGWDVMSGYRAAGSRAIRIDMLERLADMLRTQDSRKGFEATPDMLSITGLTLEQFADLMQGLGYRAEKGERVKVKKAAPAAPGDQAAPADEGAGGPEGGPAAPAQAAEAGAAQSSGGEEKPGEEAAGAGSAAQAGVPSEAQGPAEGAAEGAGKKDAGEAAAGGAGKDTAEAAGEDAAQAPAEGAGAPQEAPRAEVGSEEAQGAPGDAVQSAQAGEPRQTPEAGEAGDAGEAEKAPQTPQTPETPETEVFYIFTWRPRRPGARRARGDEEGGERGEARPQGKGGKRRKPGKPGARRARDDTKPKTYRAGPGKGGKEKEIDPDNPFAAALMALKDKK